MNVGTVLWKRVSVSDRHVNVCSWRLRIWFTRHLPKLLRYNQHEVKTCSSKSSCLSVWLLFHWPWQGSQYRNKMMGAQERIPSLFLMFGQTGASWGHVKVGVGRDLCRSFQQQCFCFLYKTYCAYFSDVFMASFPNWMSGFLYIYYIFDLGKSV